MDAWRTEFEKGDFHTVCYLFMLSCILNRVLLVISFYTIVYFTLYEG